MYRIIRAIVIAAALVAFQSAAYAQTYPPPRPPLFCSTVCGLGVCSTVCTGG